MSLHIFSKQTKIDFVGMRHYAYGLSALLILVGLITIFMNGRPAVWRRLCRRRGGPASI